jgi:hypothetical protein
MAFILHYEVEGFLQNLKSRTINKSISCLYGNSSLPCPTMRTILNKINQAAYSPTHYFNVSLFNDALSVTQDFTASNEIVISKR